MRRAFVAALVELARREPRVLLLTADLGYSVVEPFAEALPGRFFNVGVAEQNLVGVATGLAECGFVPFVYSIATFASMRPYEFIRNGPVAHRFPVRVIGVGGGFDYGPAGLTHHALEDVGILRTDPGITVVTPADAPQAVAALEKTWGLPRPVYYRLAKDDARPLPGLQGRFELGRVALVREGTDMVVLAMGSAALDAAAAVAILAERGVSCALAVVSSFNPTPVDDLERILARVPVALTVEHHYRSGGVGSLACEVVAERGLACRVVRCAVDGVPDAVSGSDRFLLARHGLGPDAIAERALAALGAGPR
ncbi:MAG TPA: transketolase C-terminal domain-containing protein [Thermoanaerobaculaceae bacterium]|nr:transketolase C-terminal domain-containing protein [Thermoanaerobaculaceae bacterium]